MAPCLEHNSTLAKACSSFSLEHNYLKIYSTLWTRVREMIHLKFPCHADFCLSRIVSVLTMKEYICKETKWTTFAFICLLKLQRVCKYFGGGNFHYTLWTTVLLNYICTDLNTSLISFCYLCFYTPVIWILAFQHYFGSRNAELLSFPSKEENKLFNSTEQVEHVWSKWACSIYTQEPQDPYSSLRLLAMLDRYPFIHAYCP